MLPETGILYDTHCWSDVINVPTCFIVLEELIGSRECRLSACSSCEVTWGIVVWSASGSRSDGVAVAVVVVREGEEEMESQSAGGSIN